MDSCHIVTTRSIDPRRSSPTALPPGEDEEGGQDYQMTPQEPQEQSESPQDDDDEMEPQPTSEAEIKVNNKTCLWLFWFLN